MDFLRFQGEIKIDENIDTSNVTPYEIHVFVIQQKQIDSKMEHFKQSSMFGVQQRNANPDVSKWNTSM